jgi:hypothetical protein
METIIEVEMRCYYQRKGFAYFKSLAGDRFKLKQGNFKPGTSYHFRLDIMFLNINF